VKSHLGADYRGSERGVVIEEVTRDVEADYESLVTLRATTARGEISVSGTVFHDGKAAHRRVGAIADGGGILAVDDLCDERRQPGLIGRFAGLLARPALISRPSRWARPAGGAAVALVAIDGAGVRDTVAAIHRLPGVKRVTAMKF